jgi:hypothetical protein
LKRPKTYGPTPAYRPWLTEIYIKKRFTFTRKLLINCMFSVNPIFLLPPISLKQIKILVNSILPLPLPAFSVSFDSRQKYFRRPSNNKNTAVLSLY